MSPKPVPRGFFPLVNLQTNHGSRLRPALWMAHTLFDMRPEKWKRNAIFTAVATGGLDARECTFDYDDRGCRVAHVPSGSYFLLAGAPGQYTSTMLVGDGPPMPIQSAIWETVQERIQRWAGEVTREVDTPDLWAETQREREILTGARYENVENTPFTSDERARITEQLRQLMEFAKETHSLSDAQRMSLGAKLDHLEAASGRVNRKDWRLMFYGVMFSLIVADLLPREVVYQILVMAFQGLGHLFGGGGLCSFPLRYRGGANRRPGVYRARPL